MKKLILAIFALSVGSFAADFSETQMHAGIKVTRYATENVSFFSVQVCADTCKVLYTESNEVITAYSYKTATPEKREIKVSLTNKQVDTDYEAWIK